MLQLIDDKTDQQTGKPGITMTTAIRMLLDKTATVEEAIGPLKKYDMYASANGIFHFIIFDASGKG